MKVSCLQENLSKGLGIVGRAVATRSTLPITNNVLVATDQSRLKLAATNLEIAITTWIGAKVEEEGAITVPARLLTEFVSTLPNDRIDLDLSPRSRNLSMKCARFEAHISGMDAEDFPPIPSVGQGVTTTVEPDVLRLAITQVVFAAATEDSRPVLTGVHTELRGDNITLAAADGFRLAVHKASLSGKPTGEAAVIIPAKAFSELNRLLTDQEEPVEITVNPSGSQILFRLKNVEMVSQLVQGTFPNYAQLIPQSYTTRTIADVGEFLRATRTASIFAKDGSGIVRLQIIPAGAGPVGKIYISARSEELGDNQGEIDAKVEGEPAKIAFNSKYLTEVLSVLDNGLVELQTTSPSSPGIIKPVGSDKYIHVVMPMFVQW